MPLTTPPFATQGGTYPATHDRLHLVSADHWRAGSSDAVREGFFPTRYPGVTVAGMDIVIGSCAGLVANDFAAGGGDYLFINQGNITVTLAAASPTQNRRDLVGFQIRDNAYDASGLNTIVPLVVQGTNSSGAPTLPAAPAGFIPIVDALVNAGVTAPTLTSLRTWTVAQGGLLPVTNLADRGTVGAPGLGAAILRTDGNRIEWNNSTGGWNAITVPVVSSASQLATVFTHPTADMLALVADVPALYIYRGAVWQQLESAKPSAKVWRTAGFTTLSTPGVTIPMNAGRARGGMVVVANGSTNSVTLPVGGFYKIEVFSYASGANTYYQFNANRQRTGVGDIPVVALQYPKTTGDDVGGFYASDTVPLNAGDVVYLSGATTSGTGSTWGVNERQGVRMTVTYERALEGATAV